MLTILKRELLSYFTSPIGYVYIAICFLTSGLLFTVTALTSGMADLTGVFVYMYFILMIVVPVLTMRLIADDNRQKTNQLLMTAPISTLRLVCGKFLSAFTIFLISISMLLVYGIVLSLFTTVNWPTIWGTWIGLVMMGGVYVAIGTFASSLTENQIIAAIFSIGLNFFIFLMNMVAAAIPWEFLSNIVRSLSVYDHYMEFTLGIFSFSNILFFLSVIVVFLFFTIRVMERRRWA